MKTIGLLGGMSWESSLEYYRLINEIVRDRLGGLHSAKSIMYSVEFAEIETYQHRGEWDKAGEILIEAAQAVERAGADCLLICTNTMHLLAPQVQAAIDIPLLHIADATAVAIKQAGLTDIGLLGTEFTMTMDFYKGRLTDQHGLNVLIPPDTHRQQVHRIIYDELCLGQILPHSKATYQTIIADLVADGAEGVILGCTEIGLLIKEGDTAVPIFDTTYLHAATAVDFALQ